MAEHVVNSNRAHLVMWQLLAVRRDDELPAVLAEMDRLEVTPMDLTLVMAGIFGHHMQQQLDEDEPGAWLTYVGERVTELRAAEAAGILDPAPGARSSWIPDDPRA